MRKNKFAIIYLIVVLIFVHPAIGRTAGAGITPPLCVLSGKVVDFDTGQIVPYFHLLYMNGNGALIEHLETDDQGNFGVTAPRGSQRYFEFGQSRRGTYVIDWDRQRQIDSQPFRGVVRNDITDLVFQVKLWPARFLAGRLLNKSGEAVKNASVYIHCDVPAVKTDAAGTFSIHVAPADRDFNLFAVSEDMSQAGSVLLKAGATSATIHLEPTLSYKGRVISTTGQPVGPFKFLLGLRPNGSDSDCLQQEIHADTDGTFTIDYLCPKAEYFAWWFPDEQNNRTIGEFGTKTIDLKQHKPDEPIEIVIEQYLNMLSGRIVNAEGEPIGRAKIMVLTDGVQARYRRHKAVYSDKEGRFSLLNLADGEVLFNVYAEGYKSRKVWAPTDTANIEIVLKSPSEAGLCEVWVVDDESRPIPNAPVNLRFSVVETGQEVITSNTARTNAAGKAEFKIKPFGDNVRAYGIICCDLDGYDLAYDSVWHQDDSQVKLVLHKAGQNWSGKIVDLQQNPVSGARLYMTSMSQRARTPQRATVQWLNQSSFSEESKLTLLTQTDANGEFALHRFNKKDFVRVLVTAPGFRRREIDFSPSEMTGTVFQLSPGVAIVKGLLVEETSRKPLAQTHIELRSSTCQAREVGTNKDGSFLIEDLEPGVYVPVMCTDTNAEYPRYVCAPEPMVAEAGKTAVVTVKAQQGIAVRGRLIDAKTGKRPAARRLYLMASLNTGEEVASDWVGEDGTWELLLPPGTFALRTSILMEQPLRFLTSEHSLPITIERNKAYDDLVLEMDDRGEVVMRPVSLVGKRMPDLAQLKVPLTIEQTENKMVVVCFFGMNQRPSRYCVLQLAKQVDRLQEKGVTVLAVQAQKTDENTLREWIKTNNISFPVGMVEADDEETPLAWGVKSLPWLILTDRDHVVTAEGFGLAELNDKIMDALDAKDQP